MAEKTPKPKLPNESQPQKDADKLTGVPKPESSSEAEGASDRKDTGNAPVEVKTETSESSGE